MRPRYKGKDLVVRTHIMLGLRISRSSSRFSVLLLSAERVFLGHAGLLSRSSLQRLDEGWELRPFLRFCFFSIGTANVR